MKITLVGMGSGTYAGLTVAGAQAVRRAGYIIGARRLLDALPDDCAPDRAALYKTDEILALLREKQGVCLLYTSPDNRISGNGGGAGGAVCAEPVPGQRGAFTHRCGGGAAGALSLIHI